MSSPSIASLSLTSVAGSVTSAASRTVSSGLSSRAPSTTTSSAASATSSDGGGGGGGGPTNSPLLFFVALGFGVVFTNLWIIVGVKYCFRYSQRNRALRAAANGEPIDLANMPRPPHRRRREKKLMTMDEVNERFPLTKYKTWRAAREEQGLPTAGGITAPGSRAASLRDMDGVIEARKSVEARKSADTARPVTATSNALEPMSGISVKDHQPATISVTAVPEVTPAPKTIAVVETGKTDSEKERTVVVTAPADGDGTRTEHPPTNGATGDDDDDEDDPIQAADPEVLAHPPGDTCAICLDSLDEDDDVRGLTCGHAFHASCVDPWLTSRRACCPLCKADYYVPKPRPEGEEEATDGRGGRPRSTGTGWWMSTRYYPMRPRNMIMTPAQIAAQRERRTRQVGGRAVHAPGFGPIWLRRRQSLNDTTEPTTEHAHSSWRSRLPGFRQQQRRQSGSHMPSLPNPFRRGTSNAAETPASGAAMPTVPTPAQLEAGTR